MIVINALTPVAPFVCCCFLSISKRVHLFSIGCKLPYISPYRALPLRPWPKQAHPNFWVTNADIALHLLAMSSSYAINCFSNPSSPFRLSPRDLCTTLLALIHLRRCGRAHRLARMFRHVTWSQLPSHFLALNKNRSFTLGCIESDKIIINHKICRHPLGRRRLSSDSSHGKLLARNLLFYFCRFGQPT